MTKENDTLMFLEDLPVAELEDFVAEYNEYKAKKTRRKRKPRNSFVCYASFFEAIELMPRNVQLRAYQVLMRYALLGELPPDDTPRRIKQSFVGWEKLLYASSKKYDAKVESNFNLEEESELK